jgi:hypothetical protein
MVARCELCAVSRGVGRLGDPAGECRGVSRQIDTLDKAESSAMKVRGSLFWFLGSWALIVTATFSVAQTLFPVKTSLDGTEYFQVALNENIVPKSPLYASAAQLNTYVNGIVLAANNAWTGTNSFAAATTLGEVHGTTDTVTLTSNNYTAAVGDCGHVKLLPTGTTPTVTLPNITGTCTITFITTAAIAYNFVAASGGSIANSQAFTHTRGTHAGDTVNVYLTTPSGTAATWTISGDVTS